MIQSGAAETAGLRFTGNETFSDAGLLRALGRFSVKVGAPMSVTNADDAAFFIGEFYRDRGFWEAQVDYRHDPAGGTAEIIIEEGSRMSVGAVDIQPAADDPGQDRLHDIALAALRRHSGNLLGNIRFSEAGCEEAAEDLRRFLAGRGYRAAAIGYDWRAGSREGAMDITFLVEAGPLFVVRGVAIDGAPDHLAAELHQAGAGLVGSVFTPDEEMVLRGRFLRKLRDRGYYAAEIEVAARADMDGGAVQLRFDLQPGPRYRFGEVRVAGHGRTFPRALLARLGVQTGDWFDASRLDAGMRRIWFTGAFADADAEILPSNDHKLDILLQVEEGRARQIRGSAGYGGWQGAFATIAYSDRNFLGTLNRLSIRGNISEKGYGGVLQLSDPALLRTEAEGSLAVFYQRQELPAYRATFFGGVAAVERRFDAATMTGYQARYVWRAVTDTTVFGDSPEAQDTDLNYTVGLIGGGQTLDRRNDMLSPMSGFLLRYDLELAARAFGGGIEFFKPTVQATWYLPLRQITAERPFVPFLTFNHRAGLIAPFGATGALPLPERFYLGGPDSVRSFQLDGMAPRAPDGSPLGGELFWLLNAEFQFPVFRSIYLATFVDAGNLAPTIRDYHWDDTRVAAGAGLRFYTPIGAIRVDYGYNLIRSGGDPIGAWQFGFGFTF